uniref:OSJNBa0009K15.2 protein n=1 Tax=Oryza sativa subsp. japonica TaxID=39947 RepID=Q7XLK8_ORYSJ|nr:OSJNBa0009K15.2 [Oryza sativa Japonica Group]
MWAPCSPKEGDEMLHKYTTPTATPSTPKEERFRIQGVRTPGSGYGKSLLRPLMASEKEGAAESRSPPPMKVKRHLKPPPIVRAPSQFQEEEVKSPEPSIHKLAAQVKKLRKENIELKDRNAELGVELADIRNNFDTLSRGLCAKIKRAFIEIGKENKYYAN